MSQNEPVDMKRRNVLLATTAVMGAAGATALLTPFVKSWNPSAKAQAAGAPVSMDISSIEDGQMITLEYRKAPVLVVKRTPEMLELLPKNVPLISDPDSSASVQPEYAKNDVRSRSPELLVVSGVCTHLGCKPSFRPEVGAADLGGDNWYGGFFCPCHGSKYDLAGRVFKGVPAPLNLPVPDYNLNGTVLTVGES